MGLHRDDDHGNNLMYHYQEFVDHLQQMHPKKSAEVLNKIFLSLLTDFLPCDFFIEAGAYEASASSFIKATNSKCQVYAFEANIDNYNHFKHNLHDINYQYMAISDFSGKIIFKQQSHTTDGHSFPKVRGNNSIKTRVLDKKTIYTDIEVPCITIDEYFKDKILVPSSIGLWIDLEGNAFEALTQATAVLKQSTFVKVEVEDQQYWENQKLSADIVDLLSRSDLIPVIRDFEGMTVAQYNILFASRALVDQNLKKYIEKILYEQ